MLLTVRARALRLTCPSGIIVDVKCVYKGGLPFSLPIHPHFSFSFNFPSDNHTRPKILLRIPSCFRFILLSKKLHLRPAHNKELIKEPSFSVEPAKMPVSGFSIEQDAEVQAYRRLRAQYLAQKQVDEDAKRASQGLPPKREKSVRDMLSDVFRGRERKSVSVRGKVVPSRKLEDDSDWEGDEKEW